MSPFEYFLKREKVFINEYVSDLVSILDNHIESEMNIYDTNGSIFSTENSEHYNERLLRVKTLNDYFFDKNEFYHLWIAKEMLLSENYDVVVKILNETFKDCSLKYHQQYNDIEHLYDFCVKKSIDIQYPIDSKRRCVFDSYAKSGLLVYDGSEHFSSFLKDWRKKNRRGLTSKIRYEVLVRDKSTCQLCGVKSKNSVLHVDHIIPIDAGGDNSLSNLRVLCPDCNIGKSNSIIEIEDESDVYTFENMKILAKQFNDEHPTWFEDKYYWINYH